MKQHRIFICLLSICTLLISLLFIVESAFALERSCKGWYEIVITAPNSIKGQVVRSPEFTGKGRAGYYAPRKCRERAREKLVTCVNTHYRHSFTGYAHSTPLECTPQKSIYSYPYQDLKEDLKNVLCRQHPNIDRISVMLHAYTRGKPFDGCNQGNFGGDFSLGLSAEETFICREPRQPGGTSVGYYIPPDLEVKSIYVRYVGNDCKLHYKVKNVGGKHTEQDIQVSIADNERGFATVVVPAGKLKNAGGEETFHWDFNIDSDKAPYTVTVNPNRRIGESDYQNNSMESSDKLFCSRPAYKPIQRPPIRE
jgi:hypothetical protein